MIFRKLITHVNRFFTIPRVRGISEIIAIITAITGVYVYIDDRYAEREIQRKVSSLEYIQEYRSGTVGKAREDLLFLWASQADTYALSGTKNIQAVKNKYVRDVLESKPGSINHVLTITVFFDQAATCVNTSVCDGAILKSNFEKDVQQHFQLYGDVLRELIEKASLVDVGARASSTFGLVDDGAKAGLVAGQK